MSDTAHVWIGEFDQLVTIKSPDEVRYMLGHQGSTIVIHYSPRWKAVTGAHGIRKKINDLMKNADQYVWVEIFHDSFDRFETK
jgi:hypothetical protein